MRIALLVFVEIACDYGAFGDIPDEALDVIPPQSFVLNGTDLVPGAGV